MTRITYTHGPSAPTLLVDGTDIAWSCAAGFTINVPAPDAPVEVTVQLLGNDFTIDGDGTLTTELPDGVHAALVASGWTPPGSATAHGLRVEMASSNPRVIANGDGTKTIQPSTCAFHPHFIRLVARNGETLMHSEDYATRSNARRAARALAARIGATVREVQQ